MSNEAVAGFIAIKTLQNKPLRYFDANFNEFRDKNMTMYIQKKYADLKSILLIKYKLQKEQVYQNYQFKRLQAHNYRSNQKLMMD